MQLALTLTLARILMALAFIGPGASHFMESTRQRHYTAAAIGALEVSAGLALALGWQVRWFALAAAAFLLVDAFIAHGFWAATPQALRNQLLHFFKNVALAGGFVLLVAVSRGFK